MPGPSSEIIQLNFVFCHGVHCTNLCEGVGLIVWHYPGSAVAFFCSDTNVSARQIVTWFIARWNIKVTFEELRAHLGFAPSRHGETQRQWSDKAIERTTPCLFGLFSIIGLMARVLHPETLFSLFEVAYYST